VEGNPPRLRTFGLVPPLIRVRGRVSALIVLPLGSISSSVVIARVARGRGVLRLGAIARNRLAIGGVLILWCGERRNNLVAYASHGSSAQRGGVSRHRASSHV
jgi:hypothetical protein